jgi:hypothetical protein
VGTRAIGAHTRSAKQADSSVSGEHDHTQVHDDACSHALQVTLNDGGHGGEKRIGDACLRALPIKMHHYRWWQLYDEMAMAYLVAISLDHTAACCRDT